MEALRLFWLATASKSTEYGGEQVRMVDETTVGICAEQLPGQNA